MMPKLRLKELERTFADKELKYEGVKWLPEVLPGIEISHFAVNDNYRRKASHTGRSVKGLGAFIYPEFIYPIIEEVSNRIVVNMVYLYAAGDDKLVSYYEKVLDMVPVTNVVRTRERMRS